MKYSFYLFLMCLFFVSCNKSVYFSSDAKEPMRFVDYSVLYETPKFTPPESAQPVSLNGQSMDFIRLVSADVTTLRLPADYPVNFTNPSTGEERSFARSEDMPLSPSIAMADLSVRGNENTENEVVELGLARREKTDLAAFSLEKKPLGYPVSPELDLRVEVAVSNEQFTPESDLTLEEREDFISLAAADVNSLHLSVHRPLDIVDKQERAEAPFVQEEDISFSPFINRETHSVRDRNTEDKAIEWDLEQQEKKKWEVAFMEGKGPDYPASPSWAGDTGADNAPGKLFIPRLLDVLFVVDTSESMHNHLLSFKEKFKGFLRYFFDFNWKLAITNADHGEHGFFLFNISTLKGRVMRLERDGSVMNFHYLDRTVEGYNQVFLDSISRHRPHEYRKLVQDEWQDVDRCELPPYCQGGNEQPLKSLKAALSKNQGFFRESADLVVVMISNSKERARDYLSGTQPEEVIEEFERLHGTEKRFEVYGIIIPENDIECLEQNNNKQFWSPEGDFSEKIARLSVMTGGEIFSICSDNYEQLALSVFHSFGTNKK